MATGNTTQLCSPNRSTRRRAWREWLRPVCEAVTQLRIAEALSVSQSYAKQAVGARAPDADPLQGATLTLDDVPALLSLGDDGARIFDAIVGQLAKMRGHVVREEHVAAEDLGNDLSSLAELQGATGKTVAELLGAIADLRIDRSEATRLRPIIREAIRLLHRWDVVLEHAEREGVLAIRGVA